MFKKILYLGLLLGLFNTNVLAEESIYVGIQASQVTFENDFIEVEPAAMVLRFGGTIDGGAGVEVRAGLGINGLEDELVDGLFEYKVESLLGLYGLYHVGWGSSASIYGIFGFTDAKIKESSVVFGRASAQETSLSAGIGLNVAGFNFEYMHYVTDPDFDITALSVGYTSSF